MTKTYVVSGRGTKFDAALWPVPSGIEIHFYFQCMREPQFYKTRTILDKLMLDVGMFPDRVALAGEMIPSHFVWAHPKEQPPSGVFRRQTGNLAMELEGTDASRPVSLSHIVKTLAADRSRSATAIHWIVREEESPEDLAGLDCQYPPRLRNAGADDGDESHHVPLSQRQPLGDPLQAVDKPVSLAHIGLGPVQEWPGVRRRANTR
jgi:hypothetical protein